MATRLELQSKLEELLGSRNVYYKPPETLKMKYPCIRYEKSDIRSHHADNMNYALFDCYDITVIDQNPDNEVIRKLLTLPRSSFDRHYISDNLNHDIIKLYY